jgi:hypothetical protein
VGWFAFGLATFSFFLLVLTRDPSLALQFSLGIAILTAICFRWWTNPVHPGILGYISPHTVIMVSSFVYLGLGSMPMLASSYRVPYLNYNLGSEEFYLPMLFVALAGLIAFDLVYRKLSQMAALNESYDLCLRRFYSPEIQGFLPVSVVFWYSVCMAVFLYMTRTYLMRTYWFVGVEGEMDNIFLQGGDSLLGTVWILMSLYLFRPGKKSVKILNLLLLTTLIPIVFGYQNRRIIVYSLLMTVVSYFFFKEKFVRLKVIVWSVILVLGAFVIMSSVKYASITDASLKRYIQEDRNIFSRAVKTVQSPEFLNFNILGRMLMESFSNRLNGLDWAASMMGAHVNSGIPFMMGEHNLLCASRIIPRAFWANKPTTPIETTVVQHFELAYFDNLGSMLGSAYADGGIAGVILGFGFLGFFFPLALKLIFMRRDGIIIYMGAMVPLLSFENYLFRYPFYWLRWVLVLMVVNSVILFLYTHTSDRGRTVDI